MVWGLVLRMGGPFLVMTWLIGVVMISKARATLLCWAGGLTRLHCHLHCSGRIFAHEGKRGLIRCLLQKDYVTNRVVDL